MEQEHPTYKIVQDPKEADAVGWGFYTNDITKPSKVYFKFPELKADEVRMKVHYAGMCYSEVHTCREDWGPVLNRPLIPGHETVGEVSHVGSDVKDFKVGDIVGFGVFRDHCGECRQCQKGNDQNCTGEAKLVPPQHGTYGEYVWGGYATALQQPAKWFFKLPEVMPLNKVAPLFCAGVTLYNPISKYCKKDDRVAVLGLGGLGHLGLQYANAWGCHVTCFTSSQDKVELCKKLGAHEVVVTSEKGAYNKYAGKFDQVIYTMNELSQENFDKAITLLDNGGAFIYLTGGIQEVKFAPVGMVFRDQKFICSCVGNSTETKAMIEFSAKHSIYPMTDEFEFDDFAKAWKHLIDGKARFRCVLKCVDGK